MTMARAHLVDPAVSRWYHCVTRCVRRAFLLGEGADDRKGGIENRRRELAEIFAVAVGGFSVSRGGSRASRSSMKPRFWRRVRRST
jgi:hypothetical protein